MADVEFENQTDETIERSLTSHERAETDKQNRLPNALIKRGISKNKEDANRMIIAYCIVILCISAILFTIGVFIRNRNAVINQTNDQSQ